MPPPLNAGGLEDFMIDKALPALPRSLYQNLQGALFMYNHQVQKTLAGAHVVALPGHVSRAKSDLCN
jgi:hypothetical protein